MKKKKQAAAKTQRSNEHAETERILRLLAWGAARQIKLATRLFDIATDTALDSDARRRVAEGAKNCWLMAGMVISRKNPLTMLPLVADALDAMEQGEELKDFLGERYDNDNIEAAFDAVIDDQIAKISDRWDPASRKAYKESLVAHRLYDPFSLREIKEKLARIYRLKDLKQLTKKTQHEKDREKNTTYEEEFKKPSDTKHVKLFDSSLRKSLKRHGHPVSGKPGRPKKLPRLQSE